MSVPPPSCTPNSTSTGSARSSVKSTIAVSKHTSLVSITGNDAIEIGARLGLPDNTDQALRNDGLALGLPVAEVGLDGARPVDIREARPVCALAAQDGATDRLSGRVRKALHQLIHHLLDHQPSGVAGLLWNSRAQADQVRDQMNIRLQRRQKFRLEHHGLEIEPLERVALDHLHHRRRKEFTDIAEPARHARCGGTEPSSAAGPSAGPATTPLVERRERA